MRPTLTTGRALSALLAAVVVSIVLGILGMHALSTQMVMAADQQGGHATMGGTTATQANGSDSGVLLRPAAEPGLPGTGADDGGGHDMGGMVMLCAAMLAATAAALVCLSRGLRRTPRFWAVLDLVSTTTRRITSRLGTGPPPVWEFSVIRC